MLNSESLHGLLEGVLKFLQSNTLLWAGTPPAVQPGSGTSTLPTAELGGCRAPLPLGTALCPIGTALPIAVGNHPIQSSGSSRLGRLPAHISLVFRSKRKVLGRKEPGDSFGSRPNSHSPVKTSGSPTGESPAAAVSTGKSSSRNEDFKALLQKKSSKTSSGTRPSAAELLKTTNPLARRVMMEFAPELDGANSQP